MIKLVYIAIVGAIYLYNAYQSNQKKRQAELNKQQQSQPQPNTAIPPVFEQRKPAIDTYRQAPREQTPLRPPVADKPKPKPKQQPKPVIKQPRMPMPVTEESIVEAKEAEPNIHAESLQQANSAYAFTTDLESYVFNPRDAVIASIILQRPEY